MTSEKKNSWVGQLPSFLPVFYVILICVGFIIKSNYYNVFGIDISMYLKFDEYLFIFLPFISTLLLALGVTLVFAGTIISITETLAVDSKKNENEEINQVQSVKKTFEVGKFLKYFLRTIAIVSSLFLFAALIYALRLSIYDYPIDWQIAKGILIFTMCLSLLASIVYQVIYPTLKNSVVNLLAATFSISLFFYIGIKRIKEKSIEVLNGNGIEMISFEYEDKIISTGQSIIFVGQTRDFIFLRDLKQNRNMIYPKEKTGAIETWKTK